MMSRRRLDLARANLWLAAVLLAASAAAAPLRLGEGDRLMVLAPHPSDETLGAGGILQEALLLDLPVLVCFFTMGENNEIAFLFTRHHPVSMPGARRALGTLRQNEALAAATQLGLATNQVVFLGYPDASTLEIWRRHWRDTPPYRSRLSRSTSVPYDRAMTRGAAHAGEDILDDLEEVLREFQPTLLALPHPADHNVDHRALYLFARVALWNLEAEGLDPELLPFPLHVTQWPEPRRYHPLLPASPPYFLRDDIEWLEFTLDDAQIEGKRAALRRHHSQAVHPAYLDAYVRKTELFGDFPDLVFPGGIGRVERDEDDLSQFRIDDAWFQELVRQSDTWTAIAQQNEVETAALGADDNDFVRQLLAGDGQFLELVYGFQSPLSPSLTLTVHLFGYRADVPFGEMPKIAIAVTPGGGVAVRDLAEPLPPETVARLPTESDEIALRIPLALLGDPDRILTGAELAKDTLPVDWLPWRVIDLEAAPAAPFPFAAAEPTPADDPDPLALPPGETAAASEPLPAPEAGPESPPPAAPAGRLVPRVQVPRRALPERTEANEPVFW